MKKILSLFVVTAFAVSSFAGVSTVTPSSKPARVYAADVLIPIGKNGEKVSMLDLSTMKVKELEQLTVKKMKLADKAGFKIAQKQLRNSINPDGTFNHKKFDRLAKKAAPGSGDFNIGGFALGFLLGLIGVLVAYLISDDKKAARTKWAWIGFGVWIVLLLIFFII